MTYYMGLCSCKERRVLPGVESIRGRASAWPQFILIIIMEIM